MKHNIIGQRFGKWLVECISHDKKYRCKCDCGVYRNVLQSNLISGKSSSCLSCRDFTKLRKPKSNLFGKKYGSWDVLDYSGNGYWKCKCKCGLVKNVVTQSLKVGTSTMCTECRLKEPSKQLIDMSGQVFSKWKVLRIDKERSLKSRAYWVCECECGNIRSVDGVSLRSGISNQCKPCSLKKGVGEAAFNDLLSEYKRSAKNRGYEWGLTDQQFREITSSNCFYTGRPPSSVRKSAGGDYIYNGIDRFENSIGYVPSNCVPCSGRVNEMKMNQSYDDFIENCRLIYEIHKRNKKNNFLLKAV